MKPKIKNVWRKHLLKILALALSFALWFYVLNSESQISDVTMKLDFQLPKNRALAELVEENVEIKLKGPRAFIRNLRERNNKIFIDLKKPGIKNKKISYKINHSDIPIPFGMEVLKITPSEIKVRLESRASRKVSLKANIVGELPDNLKLEDYELTPSEVVVEGPRSVINTIKEIKTRPIDISALEGEEVFKVQIGEIDQRVSADLPLAGIDFSYTIKPKRANVTLKNIDIFFLSRNQNFTTKSTQVALDVLVPGDSRRAIKKSEVKVIAEIPDEVLKKQRVKLKVDLPEGVHLLQIHPEYINVAPKKNVRGKRRRR